MHVPGNPLVLVNAWDVASARVVAAHTATRAIATASWSIAAAHGYPDGGVIPLDLVLQSARRIAMFLSPPEKLLDIGELQLHIGRAAVVALT